MLRCIFLDKQFAIQSIFYFPSRVGPGRVAVSLLSDRQYLGREVEQVLDVRQDSFEQLVFLERIPAGLSYAGAQLLRRLGHGAKGHGNRDVYLVQIGDGGDGPVEIAVQGAVAQGQLGLVAVVGIDEAVLGGDPGQQVGGADAGLDVLVHQ